MKSAIRWAIAIACMSLIGVFAWRVTSKPIGPSESQPSTSSSDNSPKLEYSGTVAVIGETPITKEDLEWELALHTSLPEFSNSDLGVVSLKPTPTPLAGSKPSPQVSNEPMTSDALRRRILVTLLERKMLYLWIKEHSEGFDFNNPGRFIDCLSDLKGVVANNPTFFGTPSSKEHMKNKLCEQSLIDQYLHDKILGSISSSDAEALKWYNSHSNDYNDPPKVVFRQILLATDKAAIDLRPKVNRSNFSEMARLHSIAAEAAQGGRVGPFSKEQLPSFFEIVFTMQIGEISGIVRSDYGYHIIMPIEHLSARHRPFTEVKAQIRSKITEQKKQEAYQAWLTNVMNTIPVDSSGSE